jgi:hypothetical protein
MGHGRAEQALADADICRAAAHDVEQQPVDTQPGASPRLQQEPQGPYEPFGTGSDAVVWRTDTFMLEGGQEQYLCFAKTLDEMCYFVGFAVDQSSMSACLEVLPPFIFGG